MSHSNNSTHPLIVPLTVANLQWHNDIIDGIQIDLREPDNNTITPVCTEATGLASPASPASVVSPNTAEVVDTHVTPVFRQSLETLRNIRLFRDINYFTIFGAVRRQWVGVMHQLLNNTVRIQHIRIA